MDFDFLDSRGAVGDTVRRTEDRAHLFVVGGAALGDVRLVRGIDELVIGVVELLLIHVEPDKRAFDMSRSRAALGRGGTGRERQRTGGGPCHDRAARDLAADGIIFRHASRSRKLRRRA